MYFWRSKDCNPEPTEKSKQPIRTRHLGHVTDHRPMKGQCLLIRSLNIVAPANNKLSLSSTIKTVSHLIVLNSQSGEMSLYHHCFQGNGIQGDRGRITKRRGIS
eukprot:sb/3478050/